MWKPISELPECYRINRKMFVVIGIDVHPVSADHKYTTDPVCVWVDDGAYIRWKWDFEPTHFYELPSVSRYRR